MKICLIVVQDVLVRNTLSVLLEVGDFAGAVVGKAEHKLRDLEARWGVRMQLVKESADVVITGWQDDVSSAEHALRDAVGEAVVRKRAAEPLRDFLRGASVCLAPPPHGLPAWEAD